PVGRRTRWKRRRIALRPRRWRPRTNSPINLPRLLLRLYDLFCRCVVRLIMVFFFPFYYMCAYFTFSIFCVMLSALVIF
uniref:Uncharacterized protein n=1 Tax=Aegilops tauschii subsp. strangulata TaxID=200361 RepID=A0A453HX65_AEGTS